MVSKARRVLGTLAAVALGLSGCETAPKAAAVKPEARDSQIESGDVTLDVEGTRAAVTVLMDRHAVPRISASSEADLAFGMGYMHGRDRRFQMELFRLDSQGRLREFLGRRAPAAVLRLELFSRMLGFRAEAETLFRDLSAPDRQLLEAYSAGVNAAMAREPRPFEFGLLGYEPAPWTPVDSLAVLGLISFSFCKDWEQELARLEIMVYQLKSGGSLERALSIWPPRFDLPPHLIGRKPDLDPFAGIPPVAPELALYLQESFAGKGQRLATAAGAAPGLAPGGAQEAAAADLALPDPLSSSLQLRLLSNNWAVSGAWTGTGKAAFAMDPHMPFSLPPMTYLLGIKLENEAGDSFQVVGASIPGLPAIPFGTNGKVAWGPTSNWADVADLFVEKPVPGMPGYYLTETGLRPFTAREETFLIRSRGGKYTETRVTVRSTRHGVIVNDFIDRLPADFPLLALRRAPTFGRSLKSMANLYRAGNVSQGRAALAGFTAMVGNWALADSSGNIGYSGPVNLPLRKRSLGTVPVPGWTGTYEWEGFVPQESLPGIENPPEGFLATANNQVVQPESTGYPINFEGDVPFRVSRILSLLESGNRRGDTVGRMKAIQTDALDGSFHVLLPFLQDCLEPLAGSRDKRTAQAARVLLEWDGVADPASPAATIYQSLVSSLVRETLSDEVSPATLDFLLFYFNADPLYFGILADPGNPAWDNRRTAEKESADDVTRAVFTRVVNGLARRYGGTVSGWTWRKAARFNLEHPLGRKELFDFLNREDLPARGTAQSVSMHRYSRKDPTAFPIAYGPALRLIVDFADLEGSMMSLPGGQSGRPSSLHYEDILPLYLKGDGVPLLLDPAEAERAAVARITLRPLQPPP